MVLDFNKHEQVVGIELLKLSQPSAGLNLNELQFQTTEARMVE